MKIKGDILHQIDHYSLPGLFVSYVLLDALTKILASTGFETNIPLHLKIGLLGTVAIVYLIKKPKLNELVTLGVLSLCFLTGQFFIDASFTENSLVIASKFLASLLLLFYFNKRIISPIARKRLFSFFEWVLVINSMLIFLGVFFKIDLFEAYRFTRFGYNGLLVTPSIATYAYTVALLYFILCHKWGVFKNWKFYIIFLSCFFLGTKSIFIAVFFCILFLIFYKRSKYQKTFFIVVPILFILGLYYFLYSNPVFNDILQKDSFVSALLSYRDKLLLEKTIPFISENWSVVNYFFGGVSDYNLRSQMELIDIFFFWGILGGLIYLIQFIRGYLSFKITTQTWLVFATLAPIIILSGNFFVYVINTLFILVLREKILDLQKDKSTFVIDEQLLK